MPATIHLAGAEIELVSLVAREQRLRTRARCATSPSIDDPFDYVFIDCPPSLGLLTINAFVAAREVLIPIQCEYYALEGLSQLLSNIELIEKHLNPELRLSTILLTMYDARTNLAQQVAEEVREHFPDAGARHGHPPLGARLRGAELRPDRHQLRRAVARLALVPRGRRRDRPSRRCRTRGDELMATKRTGLGRGIGALIPTATTASAADRSTCSSRRGLDAGDGDRRGRAGRRRRGLVAVPGARLANLDPHDIVPNAAQPRTSSTPTTSPSSCTASASSACCSRSSCGRTPTCRASTSSSWASAACARPRRPASTSIPAVVKDTADEDMLRDALLENLHRSQLNPLEEASAYQQLLADFGITQEELAEPHRPLAAADHQHASAC